MIGQSSLCIQSTSEPINIHKEFVRDVMPAFLSVCCLVSVCVMPAFLSACCLRSVCVFPAFLSAYCLHESVPTCVLYQGYPSRTFCNVSACQMSDVRCQMSCVVSACQMSDVVPCVCMSDVRCRAMCLRVRLPTHIPNSFSLYGSYGVSLGYV